MTDSTATVAEPGDAIAFDLLDSDPRQLGALSVKRRLRSGNLTLAESIKPFPFLAVAPPRVHGELPQLLSLKVARRPLSDITANCLREEEQWARAEHLFHSAGQDGSFEWVAREYIQGTPMNELDPHLHDDTKRQYAELLLVEIERMHASGETHLDVKLSNVIVTPTRRFHPVAAPHRPKGRFQHSQGYVPRFGHYGCRRISQS